MAKFSNKEKNELERVLDFDAAINAPLYTEIEFDVDFENIHNIGRAFAHSSFKLDIFCPFCSRESHFNSDGVHALNIEKYENGYWVSVKSSHGPEQSIQHLAAKKHFERKLYCVRSNDHVIRTYYRFSVKKITKVGQFPSLEDIVGSDLIEYKNVLENNDFVEIRKATGLASHGVNIGAYIYLRRVFERIINRAVMKSEVEDINDKRMEDKIKALKDFLPPFLVEHRKVYSFLSQGVHELSEDQCAKHFSVLRQSILLMAEQAKEIHDKQAIEAKLAKEIGLIDTSDAELKGSSENR